MEPVGLLIYLFLIWFDGPS